MKNVEDIPQEDDISVCIPHFKKSNNHIICRYAEQKGVESRVNVREIVPRKLRG